MWPGSHQKIRALAESDRDTYRHLFDLNKDIPDLDLGEPIELTPPRGDVPFFQHVLGHNRAMNVQARPRFMMRFFCSCEVCVGHWTP